MRYRRKHDEIYQLHQRHLDEMADEAQFTPHIKDVCFMCGLRFENNWEHYQAHGNSCVPCEYRISRLLSHKITREQSLEQLKLRILSLKQEYANT